LRAEKDIGECVNLAGEIKEGYDGIGDEGIDELLKTMCDTVSSGDIEDDRPTNSVTTAKAVSTHNG
jgi:hypothetical protein